MIGRCIADLSVWSRCPEDGIGVRLPTPSSRPDAVGGPYCATHGGESRARREAEREWNYLAPAEVGDADAVDAAGHAHLDSTHAYIVLREVPPPANQPTGSTRWLAWLGIGSHLTSVPSGELSAKQRRRVRDGRPPGPPKRGRKSVCSFSTREAAEEAARRLWQERLDSHVARIRAMRGGTLAWGVPVGPRMEPIIIAVGPGGDPWEAVARAAQGTETPPGLWAMSGLRPSGEVR